MRKLAAVAGFSVLLTACITGERPVLTDETLPATTLFAEDERTELPSSDEVAEPEEPIPTTTMVKPEDARALITPSGVVVPVLEASASEYVVRTPCGETATLTDGTPIGSAVVVIDPGHGGEETGAVGPNGLTEKELNLDVAERTKAELESRGFTVVLARTADYRIPLATRAEIGNRLEAEVMVSIHHNAPNWLDSETPGSEVFVQSDSDESRRLGGLIYEESVAALDQFDVAWTISNNPGTLVVLNSSGEDAYGMIRRPEMPAALAELGYLSNPPEAELFLTDEYRDVAAVALADAIERFLTTDDPGTGFVDEPRIFTPSGGSGGSGGCIDPELE